MKLEQFLRECVAHRAWRDTDDVEPTNPLTGSHNGPTLLLMSILYSQNLDYVEYCKLFKEMGSREFEQGNYNWSIFLNGLSRGDITWKRFKMGIACLNPKGCIYRVDLKWSNRFDYKEKKADYVSYELFGSGNELQRLYESIINQMKITDDEWNFMVSSYIRHGNESINSADYSTARSNIKREFVDYNKYSWKLFCKMLSIIGIEQIRFTVALKWKDGANYVPYSIVQDIPYGNIGSANLPHAKYPESLLE